MKKRILSIVLCLVMVFSLLPFTASAASATPIDEQNFPDPVFREYVRKVAGIHKVSDVTCKRGIVNFDSLWAWIEQTRSDGPAAQKTVAITLMDEARNPVRTWLLRGCIPMKYTGPTLAGKGGGDVAMEEIVLSAEGFEIQA